MFLKRHANRPGKDRVFPLALGEVRAFVSTNNLRHRDGGELPVIFRNPAPSESKEGLVAEFRPGRQLALISIIAEMSVSEAEGVWRWVLSFCPALATRRPRANSGEGPVYAFLGSVRPLAVVERWYHYQQKKYRATDKFTGGLNRKLLKLEEKPITKSH